MKILVVGGGTAGLITATILKQYLNVEIDIVQSSKIGIVGVGEGSTEIFLEYMKCVGIDHESLIRECDATYKSGIMFEGWSEKPYLHNVSSPFDSKYSQYKYVYAKQISEKDSYMQSSILWNNTISKSYINKKDSAPFNQFHFNTFKLNSFLTSKCISMGMQVFDDEIKDVNIDENGNITSITGQLKDYEYDFYIDSTGFKRLLIGKLGGKWNSFSKYLKMKAAITFPTPDQDEYNLWTIARAMDNGWMFRLPVWGRYGNGYIFDTDYTDIDSAKREVESIFGKEINFGKEFYFDAGALEKAWIGNCVAVGLSSIFVEPLEASSIGSSIQQAFLLMHRLLGYTNSSRDAYNKSFTELSINIRDFIVLHYITKKENSEFWRNISKIDLPDTLQNKLNHWKNHLPILEDFSSNTDYIMFNDSHHIVVMHGLGLFDSNSIKKEYMMLPKDVRQNADKIIQNAKSWDPLIPVTGHKEHLRIIREVL